MGKIFEKIEEVICKINLYKDDMYTEILNGPSVFNISVVDQFINLYEQLVVLLSYTPTRINLPREVVDTEESILRLLSPVNSYRMEFSVYSTSQRLDLSQADSLVTLQKSNIESIQNLVDKARNLISKSNFLNGDYKTRLLSHLEILQTEIHKTRSDVDRALAGLVEAGDVLGKFGTKARPFVKLFEDIAAIFNLRRTEPLQLPAPPKQLSPPSENADDESGANS